MPRGELRRTDGPKITDFRGQNRRTITNLQTRLTPEEAAEMVAMYADDITSEVLAELYGVCRDTRLARAQLAATTPENPVMTRPRKSTHSGL